MTDHGIPAPFRKLPMSERQRRWIDEASYDTLVKRWKNDTLGSDDIFRGEAGVYYLMTMYNKREELAMRAAREAAISGRA